jgi:hypothetical protein
VVTVATPVDEVMVVVMMTGELVVLVAVVVVGVVVEMLDEVDV